jgi:hypothetical protein
MSNTFRGRVLGYEIQHIFPNEIMTSQNPNAIKAKAVLAKITFNLEARSNKIALLINPGTLDSINASSLEIQKVFLDAGFGFNFHDSQASGGNHPGYNEFIIDALAKISDDAENSGWNQETISNAVMDLHSYVADINKSGVIPLIGTSSDTFLDGWDSWSAGKDYAALTDAQLQAINDYKAGFNSTLIDANSSDNSQLRFETTLKLFQSAAVILTPEELANAQKLLWQAGLDGSKSGKATAASISLIHDLQKRSSTPVTSLSEVREFLAALLNDEGGFGDLQATYDMLDGFFSTLIENSGSMVENLRELKAPALEAMGKSVNSMLVGLGGNEIGDAVEFLNLSYDPIKKGLQTGVWSDFNDTILTYGIAAAVSALVVAGSVAVVAGIVGIFSASAAPVAAAFVGAGWAAWGLYDAISNGSQLIGKISADMTVAFDKIDDTLDKLSANFDANYNIILRIVANALDVDFSAPVFAGAGQGPSLLDRNLIDNLSLVLPGSIEGGSADERFFGRNSASIDAGGGNDEIYVRDTAIARGGSGNDVVAGAAASVIAAGDPIDPSRPDGELAQTDQQMVLDGGEGNDWVVALGGERAVTIGGTGRDWIFNTTDGGLIYGDTESRTYERPMVDAEGQPILDENGVQKTEVVQVEDSPENSDNIWYYANTTVMDAQHNDVLKFYGFTLTGGNAEGGAAGLLAFGGLGAAIGMANFNNSLDSSGKYDPARSIYFDHLLPWMVYGFRDNGEGGLDMYVTNQFDQLFQAVFGAIDGEAYNQQQKVDAEGNLNGWMKIKNFDLVGSYTGSNQSGLAGQGTFNMVFKAVNPLADLVAAVAP